MATLGYNRQTLCRAVEILALHDADLRHRLFEAGKELLLIEPECFPELWQRDLSWIQEELTRYPEKPFLSSLENTLIHTKAPRAKKIAKRVWGLYHRLDEL